MESDDGEEVAGNIRQHCTLQNCAFQVQIFPFFLLLVFLFIYFSYLIQHKMKLKHFQ